MSTLETDLVQAATGTNTALKLKGKGSGVVKLGDGELSFPDSDGTSGYQLTTDGSGTLSWAATGNLPSSADGQALGSAALEWSDLYLADSSVIYFGADQDVTVTHDPDDGLFLKSTATADNNPFVLTLQTGETDMAADDVIGTINFQAPDEGTGTDAILVAAGIEAVSEGDFSSSSNATKLSFKTASSAAAAETMFLGSSGNLQVSSEVSAESFNLPITLNGTDGSSTDAGDNIVLDASASGINVGERLLYEGIPTTIPDNSITLAMLQQGGTDGQVLTSTGPTSTPAFEDVASGPNANYFHAHPSSNQSVPSAAHTLIDLQTEVADTAGIFDNATNYRAVIPNGEVWVLYGAAQYENNATTTAANDYSRSILHIRKNAGVYSAASFNGDFTLYNHPQISTVVTGNGSDYYDLALYQYNVPNPDAVTLTGTIAATFFMGWRIR